MAFFDFVYDGTLSQSEQGQLASGYTNALASLIAGSNELANYVGWLHLTQSGATVEEAVALRDAVAAGNFTLSGLFGAAQSKTGAVDGALVADPVPTLEANGLLVDITAMLAGLDTHTWTTVVKKDTIFHTREYFTETQEPAGYDDGWWETGGGDPEWQQGTYTFEFTGDGSQSYDLPGTQWQNVQLVVTGNGDYNMPSGAENVTLSGDVGDPAPDPYSNPSAGPSNPEGAANYVNVGPDTLFPTAGQYADGSIDLTVDYSSQVGNGTFTVVLTYEFA